jgi:uncharacterized repeat protein (TIGR03803 family)
MTIGSVMQYLLLTGLFVFVTSEPGFAGATGSSPPAITEQVLYKFCPQVGCTDGTNPAGDLIMDASGNLYGTAENGGTHGFGGTVFKLTPSGTGWTEAVLYSFCAQTNCIDGYNPSVGLIMDGSGNLYGTTNAGGSHSGGTVFKLAPSGTGWSETVLYNFCSQTNCPDGYFPQGSLILDGSGNLYGTASAGGGSQNQGVVYRLAPSGAGWVESVLYSFCAQGGSACTDGAYPDGGLIMDGSGSLYGTTNQGGTGKGTVYKITPVSQGWAHTVLYNFCSQTNCADGAYPVAGLIMDGSGNLYGTTFNAGSHGFGGTVFKLASSSTGWAETVLYSFCAQGGNACTDGAFPHADLIMDAAGNLYGTTTAGGSDSAGTVFRVAPSGSGWTEAVLYSFCSQSSCADGATPYARLIMDGAAHLYGTTSNGGNYNCGTSNAGPCGSVFQLSGIINTLSVSIVGNPGGRVISSPAAINCGATCSASFPWGTQVTLTATPSSAWGLAGWGGACSGIGNCTVTMNANASVSASFTTLFSLPAVPQLDPALPATVISPLPVAPTAF